MPTITVITVCFNAEKYLNQTIQSVINQKNVEVEYIVVDGGSTDNTIDIIKRYEPSITQWVSEPDKGIADAMNKGIKLASGDYILFLHADDYFDSDGLLEMALSYLGKAKDIVVFDTIFMTKLGGFRRHSGEFGKRILFKGICHQGVLCKRELLLKLGGFDKSYKICMDYNFFMKAYLNKASSLYVDDVLTVMRDTGISSRQDWKSLKQRFMEEKRVHFESKPSKAMFAVYILYWALYLPYRKMLFIINALVKKGL
jgi:glycosyltransferase involved in cell wall biosynthesis